MGSEMLTSDSHFVKDLHVQKETEFADLNDRMGHFTGWRRICLDKSLAVQLRRTSLLSVHLACSFRCHKVLLLDTVYRLKNLIHVQVTVHRYKFL